jgi:hypothetical protein
MWSGLTVLPTPVFCQDKGPAGEADGCDVDGLVVSEGDYRGPRPDHQIFT